MGHASCKRIWEGNIGIAITPRKKHDGSYFWSFSLVRAFRRTRKSHFEYVQNFGQEHATAIGVVMSKAFHFMEQTDPVRFLEGAMSEASRAPREDSTSEPSLELVSLPPAPCKAAA